MALSVLDLFTVGIGPSSSHTVGPMRGARHVAELILGDAQASECDAVSVQLFGSLGATGSGHGTGGAVVAGLCGERPETVDAATIETHLRRVRATGKLRLLGRQTIGFDPELQLQLRPHDTLPHHPNGMLFTAWRGGGALFERILYSVGGGSVVDEKGNRLHPRPHGALSYPYRSGAELLAHCAASGLPISGVALANEAAFRPSESTEEALQAIASEMRSCIERGCATDGVLPGSLAVRPPSTVVAP